MDTYIIALLRADTTTVLADVIGAHLELRQRVVRRGENHVALCGFGDAAEVQRLSTEPAAARWIVAMRAYEIPDRKRLEEIRRQAELPCGVSA